MKRTAFTRTELIVTILCLVLIGSCVYVVREYMNRAIETGHPPYCPRNLKYIFMGLLAYSTDNNGAFPMIDLKSGQITGIEKVNRNVKPAAMEDPFTDIPDNANRSVSHNLWILNHNGMATPKIFTCPQSPDWSAEDMLKETDGQSRSPKYFTNFFNISYSFVQPWSVYKDGKTSAQFFWSKDIDARVVIGADANNGKQPNYPLTAMPASQPANENDMRQYINSTNHKGEGQNVLYGDCSVRFEKSPYVGINQDNIYTAQPEDYKGEAGRTPGILSVRPKNEFDTVLIPNHEADLKNWDRKP